MLLALRAIHNRRDFGKNTSIGWGIGASEHFPDYRSTWANMISESSTGIYIAYPRAEEFKIAHGGPGTLVNSRHTKVGIAKDSFHASAARYRRTFDSQIKFIPLVEVSPRNLPLIEKEVISAIGRLYPRVGAAQNWFDTQERESIISLVYALMGSSATGSTDDQRASNEKAG